MATCVNLGLHACELRVATVAQPAVSRQLVACAQLLRERPDVLDAVPGLTGLVVHRGVLVDDEFCGDILNAWHASSADGAPGHLHQVAVTYAGEDLAAVAARLALQPEAVIALHAGARYTVAAIGFVPDFPYLIGLDAALVLPRRSVPRVRVPAGSVAIAGAHTGIYPRVVPGGWHILGRCDADWCTRFEPGDQVEFVPV